MKSIREYMVFESSNVYTLEFGYTKGGNFITEFVDVIDTGRRIESLGYKPGKYNMYEFAAPLFKEHYGREMDDEDTSKSEHRTYKFFAGDHTKNERAVSGWKRHNPDVEINGLK